MYGYMLARAGPNFIIFMNMELHEVEKIGNLGNHFRLFSSIDCLEVSLKPDMGLIRIL